MGRRQAKVVNNVTTSFLSDGEEEIAEYDGAGGLLRRYIPGPGTDQPIAMVTPSGGSASHNYFHTNRQGSTIAMSNDAGTVSEGPYTYDAYGQGASSAGVPFKYTGRRLDPETGLYYYRARYYSASLGWFLQTDPVGYGDNMNMYAYVGGDPVNATDPTGRTVVYGGGQFEVCFGVCLSVQVVQAAHSTTGKTDTLITVGVGVGLGVNGGAVTGVIGRPGDNTNIEEHAKGRSVTASGSLPGPGIGPGGTVGGTKGADGRPIVEGIAGAGTGGASVTVNETFSVSDAADTVASWLEPEGSSKAKADPQPPKGTPRATKTPPKPPDPKSTRSR